MEATTKLIQKDPHGLCKELCFSNTVGVDPAEFCLDCLVPEYYCHQVLCTLLCSSLPSSGLLCW